MGDLSEDWQLKKTVHLKTWPQQCPSPSGLLQQAAYEAALNSHRKFKQAQCNPYASPPGVAMLNLGAAITRIL